MSAICRAYENISDAERAVQAVLASGAPGDDVRLLMGAELHDARREAQGGFAGSVAPDEHVGGFAGEGGPRDEAAGGFAGEAGRAGKGVFGNADRDAVVTYSDGREHNRVAGHRALKRLLMDAGLDDETAESDVRALHGGRVLVLVTLDAISEERAAELLDTVAA